MLNEKLTNKELYEYIFEKIKPVVNKKCRKIDIQKNSIKLIYKNNNIFQITFEPNITDFSKIITEYSCCNHRHKEKKEIMFDEERISVNECETSIITKDDKINFIDIAQDVEIKSIEKKVTKREYLNDELIYEYIYKSEADIDRITFFSEEIMYILPDKRAVKRIGKHYFDGYRKQYYITNYCDMFNFSTMNQYRNVHTCSMSNSTQDEYINFEAEWNKTYKQTVKLKK